MQPFDAQKVVAGDQLRSAHGATPHPTGSGGKLGAVLGGSGNDLDVGAVGFGKGSEDGEYGVGSEGSDAADEAGHEAVQ